MDVGTLEHLTIKGLSKKRNPKDVTIILNLHKGPRVQYERNKPLAAELENKVADGEKGSITYSVLGFTPPHHDFPYMGSTSRHDIVTGIIALGQDNYSFDGQVFHDRNPVLYISSVAKLH
jgi:hypothetical protein